MSERNDGDENIQLLRAIPKEKENDEEREEREERAEGEEGEREEENINHYENENENHENHENNDNDDAHDNHDKDFTTSPSSELSENLAKLVSAMQAQRKADIDTSKVFYQQIINEMHLMADQFSVNFNSLLEQKNARYNQLIGEIQSRLRNIGKGRALMKIKYLYKFLKFIN